jgi:hypothetical protein
VFTATDLDGNGELDSDEMVARYGTEAGKIMKEFGMTSPEDTITKEEFVSVLDRKYHEDPVQTGKWVQFLANPPGVSKSGQRTARKAFAPDALNAELEGRYITMTIAYESAKEALRQELLEYDEPHQSEDYLCIYGGLFTKYKPIGIIFMAADGFKKLLSMLIMAVFVGGYQLFGLQVVAVTHLVLLAVLAPHNDGLKNLTEPVVVGIGLYPIATFQYSSTTLYQFSYHIR